MNTGFNRISLLEFLDKNPEKIPCMCKTLINEINKTQRIKFDSMSLNEIIYNIHSDVGLINKKIINKARYG